MTKMQTKSWLVLTGAVTGALLVCAGLLLAALSQFNSSLPPLTTTSPHAAGTQFTPSAEVRTCPKSAIAFNARDCIDAMLNKDAIPVFVELLAHGSHFTAIDFATGWTN